MTRIVILGVFNFCMQGSKLLQYCEAQWGDAFLAHTKLWSRCDIFSAFICEKNWKAKSVEQYAKFVLLQVLCFLIWRSKIPEVAHVCGRDSILSHTVCSLPSDIFLENFSSKKFKNQPKLWTNVNCYFRSRSFPHEALRIASISYTFHSMTPSYTTHCITHFY